MSVETALKNLVEYVTSGDHYEARNPYSVQQIKDAIAALEKAEIGRPRIEEIKIVWEGDDCPDISWLEHNDDWTEEENSQSAARLAEYYRGLWCFVGCRAVAVVSYPTGNREDRRLETFTSGGLWGIESDSDRTFKLDVETQELEDLKGHLEGYGVNVQNFDTIEVENQS